MALREDGIAITNEVIQNLKYTEHVPDMYWADIQEDDITQKPTTFH